MKVIYLISSQLNGIHFFIISGLMLLLAVLMIIETVNDSKATLSIRASRHLNLFRKLLSLAIWLYVVIDICILSKYRDGIDPCNGATIDLFDLNSLLINGGNDGIHERRVFNVLLNMLLFFPFGVIMDDIFHNYFKLGRSVILTLSIAFVISAFIESYQYYFHLGVLVMDNPIFRIIGAAVGVTTYRTMLIFID